MSAPETIFIAGRDRELVRSADGTIRVSIEFSFDEADVGLLSKHEWSINRGGYLQTTGRKMFHRMIIEPRDGLVIDHHDGDPLNNRRVNLRQCSAQENSFNCKKRSHSKNRLKGVTRHRKKWGAAVRKGGVRHWLGMFNTEEEAHAAYVQAATRLHGEFARFL